MPRFKIKWILLIVAIIVAIVLCYQWFSFFDQYSFNDTTHIIQPMIPEKFSTKKFDSKNASTRGEYTKVTIAVVICEQRSTEALVMIKSAIIFQKSLQLEFILLADFDLQKGLDEKLHHMKTAANNSFTYQLLNLSLPKDREEEWRNLFQPCAAQRLFLPTVLHNVSQILYVDTDVIFLNDLSDIWHHFHLMNSSQMSALTPEHEELNTGWYNRFARHPYYGKLGVNSGVMLMNLTKMRKFRWVDYLPSLLTKYKYNLTWGDQDIINILFHYHPDKLYIYSCRYNYRTDHCMYRSVCKDAEKWGVSVVHGSRGTFHNNKQSSFQAVFKAFDEYEIGTDLTKNLLIPLKTYLEKTANTSCGLVKGLFLTNLIQRCS